MFKKLQIIFLFVSSFFQDKCISVGGYLVEMFDENEGNFIRTTAIALNGIVADATGSLGLLPFITFIINILISFS